MTWFRLALRSALVLALLGLAFCGGKSGDPGSSESHFLNACDGSCPAGFVCGCGVCTQACTGDASCQQLSSHAQCLSPQSGCETVSPAGASCAATCGADADCTPLGAGLTCVGGRCTPPLSCEERSRRAESAITIAVGSASTSCVGDQDCVVVSNSSDCSVSCGAVVAATASASVAAAIDDANQTSCTKFASDGCVPPVPSCPPAPTPTCVNGQCLAADLGASDATLPGCVGLLNNLGSSCGNDTCAAADLCCSVSCDSSATTSASFCSNPSSTTCTVGAPNATFVGTTPFGPVNLSYAWSGLENGLANFMSLLFTPSSPAEVCGAVRLGIQVNGSDNWDGYLGVHFVPVLLTTSRGSRIGVGRLELDSLGADGRTPTGTLSVSGPGWDLHGSFNAPECRAFSGTNT